MRTFIVSLLFVAFAASGFTADRTVVIEQVRTELAKLLKKDATKLPVDKHVAELGADDITVVEWVMALERAFRIRIHNDKTVDPKTKSIRKDFTISSMTSVVVDSIESAKPKKR